MFQVNIYVKANIKAPQKHEAKAMWLVEFVREKNPEDPITRQGFVEFAETTEDAIVLTALIEAVNILTKECEICIFTKARNVLATLDTRRYEGWRHQKWLNASQNMVKMPNCGKSLSDILQSTHGRPALRHHHLILSWKRS